MEQRADETDRRRSARAGTADQRPTAFISYAQTSPEWQQTVLRFATALRRIGGVDAELDLWYSTDHQQWTTFGATRIRESDFVLVAVNGPYSRAWQATNSEAETPGTAREAAAIKAIFERDQKEFLRRVKLVLLPGATKDDVPGDLFGFNERFEVLSFDLGGLEGLLRSLYGKPKFVKPHLGPLPVLPQVAMAEIEAASVPLGTAGGRVMPPPADAGQAESVERHNAATLRQRLSEVHIALGMYGPNRSSTPGFELLKRRSDALSALLEELEHAPWRDTQ